MQTRRCFLTTTALAGTAGFLRPPAVFAAEERLETTTVRLTKVTDMCMAPQFVMEDLLRAEGFTDIKYIEFPIPEISQTIGSGKADLGLGYIHGLVLSIDRGLPITMVAGVMVGCVEVFAQESIRSVGDLKGKKLGVRAAGSGPHGLLAAMLAHVGLDPAKDVEWVADPKFSGRQGRCDRVGAAGLAGVARPQDRPCHRQQRGRSPVVAIFLLHAGRL